VKKILDKYLPVVWRQHKAKIYTANCDRSATDQRTGGSGAGVFCASWVALSQNRDHEDGIYSRMAPTLWEAYQHVVIHDYAHVIIHDVVSNGGLIDTGESDPIRRYTGAEQHRRPQSRWYVPSADNQNGWPAMDDLDPWSELLSGGDGQEAVRQGLEKTHNVDEMLVDCIARDAKPNVKGAHWLRDVPGNSSGCSSAGMQSARRFAEGGQR